MKDYYYILGVDTNCTTADIRDAYRKLSKKFHPDLNQNDTYFESRFKDIQEAYETLVDPASRNGYNASFSTTQPPSFTAAPPKQKYYPRTTAIDVIFTIILISVTILFGNYVWKVINDTKKIKTKTQIAVTTLPAIADISTHHKRKKQLLNPTIVVLKAIPKSKLVVIEKPLPTITNFTKQTLINNMAKVRRDTFKPHVEIVKQASQVADNNTGNALPYSSYIRSNITGVVNMHKMDSFNSSVVAVIPANSKVTVLARGVNYYKVQYNDGIGYVPRWTVLTK